MIEGGETTPSSPSLTPPPHPEIPQLLINRESSQLLLPEYRMGYGATIHVLVRGRRGRLLWTHRGHVEIGRREAEGVLD